MGDTIYFPELEGGFFQWKYRTRVFSVKKLKIKGRAVNPLFPSPKLTRLRMNRPLMGSNFYSEAFR